MNKEAKGMVLANYQSISSYWCPPESLGNEVVSDEPSTSSGVLGSRSPLVRAQTCDLFNSGKCHIDSLIARRCIYHRVF